MKTINVYYNYAAKTNAGHLYVEDDVSVDDLVKQWIEQGYAKVQYSDGLHWVYINWAWIVCVGSPDDHV